MKSKMCYGVVLAVLLASAPAVAQVSDTDLLQQFRAEIQTDRQALVAANLGLTDAEGQAFWPIYRQYRAEMGAVGDRMQQLIMDYAEAWEAPTEDQARAMIDELMAIRKEDLKVRKSYVKKFRKVLPEVKVAQFVQLENKIDAIISYGLADAIPLVGTSS